MPHDLGTHLAREAAHDDQLRKLSESDPATKSAPDKGVDPMVRAATGGGLDAPKDGPKK